MPRAKQISVSCQDRPGTLAHLAKMLGEAKVNIVAMNCAAVGMHGAVRILVDNVNRAKEVLDQARFPYTEQEVLTIELPNSPGSLGEFAGKLAAQNINVTEGYGTAAKGCKKVSLVFAVSDLDKAARIR